MSDVLHHAVVVLASMPTTVTVHGVVQGATEIHAPTGGLEIKTDPWSVAATIASALVALLTGALAVSTQRLAAETKQSIKAAQAALILADKHHQESQAPVLVMRGLTVTAGTIGQPRPVFLRGVLENVGFGVATGIVLRVKLDVDNSARESVEIGALDSGKRWPFEPQYRNWLYTFESTNINMMEDNSEEVVACVVTLTYRSIFGGERTTTYRLLAQFVRPVDSEQIGPQEIVQRPVAD
jgi:hypothetical protein